MMPNWKLGPSSSRRRQRRLARWRSWHCPPPSPSPPLVFTAAPLEHHWFFRVKSDKAAGEERWKPFSMADSMAIEDVFGASPDSKEVISADGGRYDVCIADRTKNAVYWKEEPLPIRRCSWFYK